MKYSEIYNKAANLVEKGWTQDAMARNEQGAEVYSNSRYAISWCLGGALNCASQGFSLNRRVELRKYLGLDLDVPSWNDDPNRTKEDVIKLLRDAAKRADKEGIHHNAVISYLLEY